MNLSVNLYHVAVVALLLTLYFCLSLSSPVSYKEEAKEAPTTRKIYKDRFKMKMEYGTVSNGSSTNLKNSLRSHVIGSRRKEIVESPKDMFKVKSVMPGEKTLKQSDDDDDDDDDDGGEYEGLDVSESVAKKKEHVKQDSMPMVMIRELDMLAVEIPVRDAAGCQKEGQKPGQKFGQKDCHNRGDQQREWSAWSPCGDGLQSRWRPSWDLHDKDVQTRPCHNDCDRDLSRYHMGPYHQPAHDLLKFN